MANLKHVLLFWYEDKGVNRYSIQSLETLIYLGGTATVPEDEVERWILHGLKVEAKWEG